MLFVAETSMITFAVNVPLYWKIYWQTGVPSSNHLRGYLTPFFTRHKLDDQISVGGEIFSTKPDRSHQSSCTMVTVSLSREAAGV